jgi:hypothetical protein
VFLQYPSDLLFRKAAALHALVLVVGQSELQPGLSPRGNVTLCVNPEFLPQYPPNCLSRLARHAKATKKSLDGKEPVMGTAVLFGPVGVPVYGPARGRVHVSAS